MELGLCVQHLELNTGFLKVTLPLNASGCFTVQKQLQLSTDNFRESRSCALQKLLRSRKSGPICQIGNIDFYKKQCKGKKINSVSSFVTPILQGRSDHCMPIITCYKNIGVQFLCSLYL